MKAVNMKCKCGRVATLGIVKAEAEVSPEIGDVLCDKWICGDCGHENVSPVVYELKQAG